MEGPLSKWTNVVNGWQYRWFVLDENAGVLSYYTSREKMIRGDRRGCIKLRSARMGIDDEDESTFTITVDSKTFHFQARDADERQQWLEALEETRDAVQSRQFEATLAAVSNVTGRCGRSKLTIKDFDRKLVESDCYLQLLIEQKNALESRLQKTTTPTSATTDHSNRSQQSCEDGLMYSTMLLQLKNMIELVKQGIVVLQMSKQKALDVAVHLECQEQRQSGIKLPTSSRPVNASNLTITSALSDSQRSISSIGQTGHDFGRSTFFLPATSVAESVNPSKRTTSGVDCSLEMATGVLFNPTAASKTPIVAVKSTESTSSAAIVQDSYWSTSSDDDDDEFYECDEALETDQNKVEGRMPRISLGSGNSGAIYCDTLCGSSNKPLVNNVIQADDDEFDELYDRIDEDDLVDMDSHGSVVSHLISQVRIGMDLTKVTLPTFILEKRSTLEMYADFLAHPDLWAAIGKGADPRERLMACLRWYLSAFHAGRRSSVAKKPYNPLLGETFQCWWDLAPQTDTDKDLIDPKLGTDESSGRPVPWASDRSVAFLAEQVSHHPPISAFYAEQRSSGQFLNGYLWTKSKFLGLSIAVHMVGQAVISLPLHDEEYVVTFPSGYGRSILSTPWIELGGKCRVECPQSGYVAHVEFCTKPFYGGKRDRVKAECFGPNDKRAFCTITGAWNGSMDAVWDNGVTETFVDTKALPVLKKRVRARSSQAAWESRRLWQDVTEKLKNKQIDAATTFKAALEQKQRDDAKQRLESQTPWETRYFHEQGEHWLYDKPLTKRMSLPMKTT